MATKKLDYADVMKVAGEMGIGADDAATAVILKETNKVNAILGILRFFKIDPADLIRKLIALALEKIRGGGGGEEEEKEKPTKPAPTPTTPTTPAPAPTTPTPELERVITDFHLKPRYYQPDGNQGRFANKAEFDAVLISGGGPDVGDPMVPKSRFAFDCDILDQYGNELFIPPNSPEAHARLWWPADAPEGLRNTQRMRWFLEDGDGIAELHDNQDGFNPYIKIPAVTEMEKGRNYYTGRLFGVFTFPDGRTKETNRMPTLRIKR